MPVPSQLDVFTRARALLDDDAGAVYTDPICQHGFTEAFDAIYAAFELHQCPAIQIIASYHLPAMQTSFTPAQAGWDDFANLQMVEERQFGSTDTFNQVFQTNRLPQRTALNALCDFVWRQDAFFFVGATTDREVRVTYDSSGSAPIAYGSIVNVDGSLTFLGNYTAAVIGPRKGDDERAAELKVKAVGPKYDLGVIGGDLYRLIQPRVRERQNTQVAPRPFTAGRGGMTRRRAPYIVAQSQGGNGVAAQFTSADGTIIGVIDGANTSFFLSYPVSTLQLYVNGLLMTQNLDYSFGANAITFLRGAPPLTAVLTAVGSV